MGKTQWEYFFGDVGDEPSLPPNIEQILNGSCPFWPGRKVFETHLFILIPKTVNKNLLTLDYLVELIQRPRHGDAFKVSYRKEDDDKNFIYSFVEGHYSTETSHWALMTRKEIPFTHDHFREEASDYLAKAGYQVPNIFDAAISTLMNYFAKGEKTGTYCAEQVDVGDGYWYPTYVGTNPRGYGISASDCYGPMAGLKKL